MSPNQASADKDSRVLASNMSRKDKGRSVGALRRPCRCHNSMSRSKEPGNAFQVWGIYAIPGRLEMSDHL